MFRRCLVSSTLLLALSCPALAQPDPRCFPVLQEVPAVGGCGAFQEEYDKWYSAYQGFEDSSLVVWHQMRDLDAPLEAFAKSAAETLSPIDIDQIPDIVLTTTHAFRASGKKMSGVVELIDLVKFNLEFLDRWSDFLKDRTRLEQVYEGLQDASHFARDQMLYWQAELSACKKRRQAQLDEIERIEAENRAARPELPASDPLCNPGDAAASAPAQDTTPAGPEETAADEGFRIRYGDLDGVDIGTLELMLRLIEKDAAECGARADASGCYGRNASNTHYVIERTNRLQSELHGKERTDMFTFRDRALQRRSEYREAERSRN